MGRLQRQRSTGGYDRWERRTSPVLLLLALAFLAVLVVPVLAPTMPPTVRRVLTALNVLIWAIFTLDYLARLYLARLYLATRRWGFVRAHLVDLAVIALPVLRPLRAVRLLRAVRVGALVGVFTGRAERSLHARVSVYTTGVAALVVFLAAVAMLDAERGSVTGNIKTLPDALWWAAATVTTVEYGDRYPTTQTGRAVAVALMLAGIALLGVLTAAIAAWFVDRLRRVEQVEQRAEATLAEILAELRDLRAQLAVIERSTDSGHSANG